MVVETFVPVGRFPSPPPPPSCILDSSTCSSVISSPQFGLLFDQSLALLSTRVQSVGCCGGAASLRRGILLTLDAAAWGQSLQALSNAFSQMDGCLSRYTLPLSLLQTNTRGVLPAHFFLYGPVAQCHLWAQLPSCFHHLDQ